MGIIALLGNVWIRRAGVVLAAIALLYGAKLHFENVGKNQGKLEAAQNAKDQASSTVAQARADFTAQLADNKKLMDAYASQLAVATQQTKAALDLAAQLNKDRAAAAGNVGKLPDSEVHGFVLSTLGLRKPGEVAACYTPAEEREIALRVVDDPKCKQENDQNKAAVESITKQASVAIGQRNAMVTNYNNLAAYTGKVEKAYVDIYNDFPRRRNWLLTIVTFGVRGKAAKLQYPDPAALKVQPAP